MTRDSYDLNVIDRDAFGNQYIARTFSVTRDTLVDERAIQEIYDFLFERVLASVTLKHQLGLITLKATTPAGISAELEIIALERAKTEFSRIRKIIRDKFKRKRSKRSRRTSRSR